MSETDPPENGFGAGGEACACAKLPNVIAFSDDPSDSNNGFFCGVVDANAFEFIDWPENVPKPDFGLPNVADWPKAGVWPNTGWAAAAAVKPNAGADVGEPKPV